MGQDIDRKKALAVRSKLLTFSNEVDGATTTDIVRLPAVASKITVQSTGGMTGSFEISLDGETFSNSTAFGAGVLVTFSAHLAASVKVTRATGTGKLIIAIAE